MCVACEQKLALLVLATRAWHEPASGRVSVIAQRRAGCVRALASLGAFPRVALLACSLSGVLRAAGRKRARRRCQPTACRRRRGRRATRNKRETSSVQCAPATCPSLSVATIRVHTWHRELDATLRVKAHHTLAATHRHFASLYTQQLQREKSCWKV